MTIPIRACKALRWPLWGPLGVRVKAVTHGIRASLQRVHFGFPRSHFNFRRRQFSHARPGSWRRGCISSELGEDIINIGFYRLSCGIRWERRPGPKKHRGVDKRVEVGPTEQNGNAVFADITNLTNLVTSGVLMARRLLHLSEG